MDIKHVIDINTEIRFNNSVDFCIGTGRMGLALSEEYMKQLKVVQDVIGFKHIRGHGLFSDDMAIYQKRKNFDKTETVEYCFTYLDRVMDGYLRLGIRPFLELGFMPEKMASGSQTIFYWKGNVTPPADYDEWAALIKATLNHLIERYGRNEVVTWPVEVWNEPNLPGFWKGADMNEYFKLYLISARAVKETDSEFKVGGPAICGVDDERWLKEFLEFVNKENAPLDFITRHHYTSCPPEPSGHYGYIKLHKPEEAFSELERSREITDSFEKFKGMDIHITEFNTSYIPNAPIHDTNLNAAYVAHMLSRLGDKQTSYSYWTFGDVFEEQGVAFTPFSGGFGLVANGCIPKPTFWTFAFFKKLKGKCIHKTDNAVIIKSDDGTIKGCIWNPDIKNNSEKLVYEISVNGLFGNRYSFLLKTVDENTCNPLKLWHDLGEPAYPTDDITDLLKQAAQPFVTSDIIKSVNGAVSIKFNLSKNAVQYFELKPYNMNPDLGYSYNKTISQEVEL